MLSIQLAQTRKETKITNVMIFQIFLISHYLSEKNGSSTQKKVLPPFSGEFQVEGAEEVQTPAGRFMAFRIHLKQTNLSSKKTGWIRYWYSPEVGQRVKQEIEKSGYWARIARIIDNEIIAYELK